MKMKYETPNMEVKWLETREIFMTVSNRVESGGSGDGTGFGNDSGADDGF